MSRFVRKIAAGAVALIVAAAAAGCALEEDAESGTTEDGLQIVRVGYLHTVAVDTHMWLGMAEGIFADQGIKIEPVEFDTGIEESQALTGGSIDVAMMGGVLSNFPATGGGKVFLANDVEFDTAQLWVRGDSGIKSVNDLEGEKVATTEGTTAHVYLHNALEEAGVDPDSVEILNTEMPAAVSAFVADKVSALALWVPFDETVKNDVPDAELIDSAKEYYPESAILGGWVANNDLYADEPETLEKLSAAWMETNDLLVKDPDAALEKVHEEGEYSEIQELADTKRQFSFAKVYPNDKWARMWEEGEVERWIGQVEQIFVDVGGIPEYAEPEEFVDSELFLNAYDDWKAGK